MTTAAERIARQVFEQFRYHADPELYELRAENARLRARLDAVENLCDDAPNWSDACIRVTGVRAALRQGTP